MGLDERAARCVIRVSVGRMNTEAHMLEAANALNGIAQANGKREF